MCLHGLSCLFTSFHGLSGKLKSTLNNIFKPEKKIVTFEPERIKGSERTDVFNLNI